VRAWRPNPCEYRRKYSRICSYSDSSVILNRRISRYSFRWETSLQCPPSRSRSDRSGDKCENAVSACDVFVIIDSYTLNAHLENSACWFC
jgi:hypothetical protein